MMVTQCDGLWLIDEAGCTVRFDPRDLSIAVQAGGVTWRTMAAAGDDLIVEQCALRHKIPFAAARECHVTPLHRAYLHGLRVELSGFEHAVVAFDFTVRLLVLLEEPTRDLICELCVDEGAARVKECLWPRAIDPACFDHTVLPYAQGMLIPKHHPGRIKLCNEHSHTQSLSMPWWGHQQGPAAMMMLFETPDDVGYPREVVHEPGGPTVLSPRWFHSLGRLSYPRRVRYSFLERGNYVDLARRYRRSLIESGQFVAMRQKLQRTPKLERLIGAPVIYTPILLHTMPTSQKYKKDDPAANRQLTTFETCASKLRRLKARGVTKAYVHVDGWGRRGYDNLHPDVLPPCPEAGGWDGLRHLANTCDELDYLMVLHDQYRDYYHDADSYNPDMTVIKEDGERPFNDAWLGGNHSLLCSRFAPGHLRKNHRVLLEQGIKIHGAYLDVFCIVQADECYHSDHPVTRRQCLDFRAQCFGTIEAWEGIVSSEEPVAWAMPHLHLVHHAPFAIDPPWGNGPAMAIPIPLHGLVFHDSIFTPWPVQRGAWLTLKGDLPLLHALSNGGLPHMGDTPSDEDLAAARTVCALHQRVALQPMLKHEFLDEGHRRQRTTFGDGTTVTTDLNRDEFEVYPPLK